MVGIDLGIVHFAILSTGEVIEPKNILRKEEKKLTRLQKHLSRKTKYPHKKHKKKSLHKRIGKNWLKAKGKVAKQHAKIKNTTRDTIHQSSTDISKKHAVVAYEDLKIKNMSVCLGYSGGAGEKRSRKIRSK
jgi:putative transposase